MEHCLGSSRKLENSAESRFAQKCKYLCMEVMGRDETLRKIQAIQEMWKHLQTIYEPTNDAQLFGTLQPLVNY